jgi:hypothetical protein
LRAAVATVVTFSDQETFLAVLRKRQSSPTARGSSPRTPARSVQGTADRPSRWLQPQRACDDQLGQCSRRSSAALAVGYRDINAPARWSDDSEYLHPSRLHRQPSVALRAARRPEVCRPPLSAASSAMTASLRMSVALTAALPSRPPLRRLYGRPAFLRSVRSRSRGRRARRRPWAIAMARVRVGYRQRGCRSCTRRHTGSRLR